MCPLRESRLLGSLVHGCFMPSEACGYSQPAILHLDGNHEFRFWVSVCVAIWIVEKPTQPHRNTATSISAADCSQLMVLFTRGPGRNVVLYNFFFPKRLLWHGWWNSGERGLGFRRELALCDPRGSAMQAGASLLPHELSGLSILSKGLSYSSACLLHHWFARDRTLVGRNPLGLEHGVGGVLFTKVEAHDPCKICICIRGRLRKLCCLSPAPSSAPFLNTIS